VGQLDRCVGQLDRCAGQLDRCASHRKQTPLPAASSLTDLATSKNDRNRGPSRLHLSAGHGADPGSRSVGSRNRRGRVASDRGLNGSRALRD
jgi:hypothetical protein